MATTKCDLQKENFDKAIDLALEFHPELKERPCHLVDSACLIYVGMNMVKLEETNPKKVKTYTQNPKKVKTYTQTPKKNKRRLK